MLRRFVQFYPPEPILRRRAEANGFAKEMAKTGFLFPSVIRNQPPIKVNQPEFFLHLAWLIQSSIYGLNPNDNSSCLESDELLRDWTLEEAEAYLNSSHLIRAVRVQASTRWDLAGGRSALQAREILVFSFSDPLIDACEEALKKFYDTMIDEVLGV